MNEHPDIAVWALSGVVGVMAIVLWWSFRVWIKGINEKIAEMMTKLEVVGNKNIGFEKDISRLDRQYESHDRRMHDYSERLRELEQKQASCRNCTIK